MTSPFTSSTGRGPFASGSGAGTGSSPGSSGSGGPGTSGSGGAGGSGSGGGGQGPGGPQGPGAPGPTQGPGGQSPLVGALLELTKLYGSAAQGGVSSQVTDAITQSLLAILGSGPSIAAFENLMSINAANGMMYYNAVDHQQKTNLLGMAMTAKCVRYMLDPPSYEGFAEAVSGGGDPTQP